MGRFDMPMRFSKLREVTLSFGLALFTLSGQIVNAQINTLNWSEKDQQAVAHALSLAKGVPSVTLDMSDPDSALFLKRHFQISGFTQERYPGLHALIAEHEEVHAANGVTQPLVQNVTDDLVYSDLATLMLAVYETPTPSTFSAMAAASMEAPADDPNRSMQISYSSLCFYDSNNAPIGTCQTESSFGSGQYFPVTNTLSTPDNAFTAAFSATYYDPTNKRYVAQLSTRDLNTIDYPQMQTIADPVIVHASNNNLKTALVCTSRSVNANANPGSCDYGTYSNTGVLVSMEGSVTYQATQTPKTDGNGNLVGTGSVFLVNTVTGGGCQLSPAISGANFFSQSQVTYNAASKTLAWNFDNLDFGSASALICGGDGTNIQYSLTLQVDDATDPAQTLLASQVSVPGTVAPHLQGPNAGSMATPMLRLVAGCLHPDTLITMAENLPSLPISKITGEGELITSMGGVETHVIGTVDGHEETLFAIQASNGMAVQASALHPFVMADGSWRAAADLASGDRVLSADGVVELISVTEVTYGGAVHNLM
ncbi:MAG: Hint domain-containing protein, partial [Sulfitobacter sp.]